MKTSFQIRGFFRGATTSLPRALIGTSQLTSFAVARETLQKFETFQENALLTTILAGTVAGVVLSMAMTPFDLVLTKMYKQGMDFEVIYNLQVNCSSYFQISKYKSRKMLGSIDFLYSAAFFNPVASTRP